MKKIIIILFTIVLGVYIGKTFITGEDATSLKKGAESIFTKTAGEISTAAGTVVD